MTHSIARSSALPLSAQPPSRCLFVVGGWVRGGLWCLWGVGWQRPAPALVDAAVQRHVAAPAPAGVVLAQDALQHLHDRRVLPEHLAPVADEGRAPDDRVHREAALAARLPGVVLLADDGVADGLPGRAHGLHRLGRDDPRQMGVAVHHELVHRVLDAVRRRHPLARCRANYCVGLAAHPRRPTRGPPRPPSTTVSAR